MSDDWDSYLCHVNDRPASILVDLGLVAEAPLARCPRMGYVLLDLKDPDENGFPRHKEHETLAALEDVVREALTEGGNALFVGRCITDGRSDLMFYVASPQGWDDRVSSVMLGFPSYAWETGLHDDPEWETYFDFLYPSEPDLLCIQNRRVCRRLEAQGDNLSQDRLIEHWLDFSSAEGRAAFSAEARALGFVAEDVAPSPRQTGEEPSPEGAADAEAVFPVRLSRSDSPEQIDEVTLTLAELAERFEGAYNGWGSPLAE